MSYIPKLEHCYELWNTIREKMEELKVYNNETSEWLEETMNNHIVETKEAVIHDIHNSLDIIALYDRKRLKERII
jgi:hypothetical protein